MQNFSKTLIRLCECAGWFDSSLAAYVRMYVFSRWGWFPLDSVINTGSGGRGGKSVSLSFWKGVFSKRKSFAYLGLLDRKANGISQECLSSKMVGYLLSVLNHFKPVARRVHITLNYETFPNYKAITSIRTKVLGVDQLMNVWNKSD